MYEKKEVYRSTALQTKLILASCSCFRFYLSIILYDNLQPFVFETKNHDMQLFFFFPKRNLFKT